MIEPSQHNHVCPDLLSICITDDVPKYITYQYQIRIIT